MGRGNPEREEKEGKMNPKTRSGWGVSRGSLEEEEVCSLERNRAGQFPGCGGSLGAGKAVQSSSAQVLEREDGSGAAGETRVHNASPVPWLLPWGHAPCRADTSPL